MKRISSREKSDGKLPVFVFPTVITFFTDDKSTHKQVLTLYNPYDFNVQFRVLCTNPTKYNVTESEGTIEQKCCIDIVIRVIDFQQVSQREDKFRVHFYNHRISKLIGTTDVVATVEQQNLLADSSSDFSRRRKRSAREAEELFLQQQRRGICCDLQENSGRNNGRLSRWRRDISECNLTVILTSGKRERLKFMLLESVIVQRSLPSIPVILLSLVCIIALMLPTYGDDPLHEMIPIYLHLTMNQKLIAAYVLGLVTMAVLKT